MSRVLLTVKGTLVGAARVGGAAGEPKASSTRPQIPMGRIFLNMCNSWRVLPDVQLNGSAARYPEGSSRPGLMLVHDWDKVRAETSALARFGAALGLTAATTRQARTATAT